MRGALILLPLLVATPALAAAEASHPAQPAKGEFCVSDTGLSSPIATEEGQLLLRGEPSSHPSYIAVFKGGRGCPGARADSTVIIERDGSQYCSGDKVRFRGWGETIPGPTCIIDHFDRYTPPPSPPRKGR